MGGSPTSGFGTGAGYIGALLGGLKKGYEEKRQREEQKLGQRANVISEQVKLASQKAEEVFRSPNASEEQKKLASEEAAQAYGEYDKLLKELEKRYQPDKTLWSKIKGRLMGKGGAQPGQQQGAQPAPTPSGAAPGAGPAGAAPSAGNAQPANPYAAMMGARRVAGEQTAEAGAMEANVTKQELQERLYKLAQTQEGRQAAAEILTIHQKVGSGQMTPDEGVQRVWQAGMKANPNDPTAGQREALSLLQMGKTSGRLKGPEIDKKITELQQGISGGLGYYRQPTTAARYPTGKLAEVFARSGVPIKPYDQITPDEWKKVSDLSKREYQQALQRAAATHDHRYQEFNARTVADRNLIGRLETRIGQIQNLMTDSMRDITDQQKQELITELADTRAQLAEHYDKVQGAFSDIYGGKGAARPAPAPAPTSGTPTPSPRLGPAVDQIAQ